MTQDSCRAELLFRLFTMISCWYQTSRVFFCFFLTKANKHLIMSSQLTSFSVHLTHFSKKGRVFTVFSFTLVKMSSYTLFLFFSPVWFSQQHGWNQVSTPLQKIIKWIEAAAGLDPSDHLVAPQLHISSENLLCLFGNKGTSGSPCRGYSLFDFSNTRKTKWIRAHLEKFIWVKLCYNWWN